MCLAVPGCVESIHTSSVALARTARVRFGDIAKDVNLSLVPEAAVGDFVLVHVGVAIQRIDGEGAQRVLQLLDAMAELDPAPEGSPPAAEDPGGGSP